MQTQTLPSAPCTFPTKRIHRSRIVRRKKTFSRVHVKSSIKAQAALTAATIKHYTASPYDRVFNFSAGPACLPLPVLEEAQRDLLNWRRSGMSVLEMSHRGAAFDGIAKQAESDLRTLMHIPDNYFVLFLQGGASTQFSAVPLNLSKEGETVDYIVTGSWSKKAASEAKRYCNANVAAQGDNKSIPNTFSWNLSPDASYLHICDNETIQGVEFQGVPNVSVKNLVADMSSNFCSKPVNVEKFGCIYAGAQKNIGGAGVTVVIVRKDLVGHARPQTPIMLNYETMAETASMYNTPPCFAIYVCGLVFQYLLKKGGLKGVEANNRTKARLLYEFIDNSDGFYASPVDPAVRSIMNVPFVIPSKPQLEKTFVDEAKKVGLVELKGHRSVGGMRASIYNSMPVEGVETLVQFMKDFAVRFG